VKTALIAATIRLRGAARGCFDVLPFFSSGLNASLPVL
jgi:hypothetical protein